LIGFGDGRCQVLERGTFAIDFYAQGHI